MYLVIDTENTLRNKGEEAIGTFKADPHHPDNKIVFLGARAEDFSDVYISIKLVTQQRIMSNGNCDLLIGHNISHDLLYLLYQDKAGTWREWLKTGRIWDTMLVEYILSGQQETMPSLDKLSIKYGGTLKDDKIKKYWDDGVETEDIPDAELVEYLKGDVENTEKVFLAQAQQALDQDMLPLVLDMMDARLATIMMEYDGMHYDKKISKEEYEANEVDIEILKNRLAQKLIDFYPTGYFNEYQELTFSQKVLHPYFFGGEVSYYKKEPCGIYKTGKQKGQPKDKKVLRDHLLHPNVIPHDVPNLEKGKNGLYSLDEDALKSILNTLDSSKEQFGFIEDLLKLRFLEKDNQMLKQFESWTWPHTQLIHPKYNHAIAVTGRLSCSNPNLQQVPRDKQ